MVGVKLMQNMLRECWGGLGVVTQASDLSTLEAEAGGALWSMYSFRANLVYLENSRTAKKETTEKA